MLLALLILLFSFLPAAQPAETWYFGFVDADLIAFTATGEQRTVAPDFGEIQVGWRFDDQTALFMSEDSAETAHLYRATPDGATEIEVPGSPDLSNLRLQPAHSGDYVMLSVFTPGYFPAMGVLVNVPAASAEVLTGRVTQFARFDGDLLRYASVNDAGDTLTLLERSLTSGEERAIYTHAADPRSAPSLAPNGDGSRWIHVERTDGQINITLVNLDGTTETLDSGTREQPTLWQFFEDALISYPPFCEADCTLTIHDGQEQTQLALPPESFITSVLARPSPETLLVAILGGDDLLLLESAAARSLGAFDPVSMLVSANAILSPDGRYLFSVVEQGDAAQFFVTDLARLTPVYAVEDAVGVQVHWFERGFIASTYGRDVTATAYLYDSQMSLELPNRNEGTYFEILPDHMLLYMLNRDEEAVGAAGIYRYDPAQRSYTLLVEAARVAYALPLE